MTSKLKILHIINNLAKGGAERLLVDVTPLYKNFDQEITILQLSDKHSSKDYQNILAAGNVKVVSLTSGSLYNPLLISKLKSFISKSEFDVIHVHLFPSMYWASLAYKLIWKPKSVLVFTEHSTKNNRLNNPVFKPIDKFIYKTFDSIIAISANIQTKLIHWIDTPNKIKLIRNGVNTQHFNTVEMYDRTFFKETYNIPEDATILLMTARFLYPKDHSTVINALKYLPGHFHLIFAGEGEQKTAIQQQVVDNDLTNRIHFAGFRTDIASFMKSVDFNILSSLYEGMSGVTLEALAAGTVFLGSDVPGINDVVPDKRFLFEGGNAIHLANAIIAIDENTALRKNMIETGLAYVQTFDVSIMIKEHIALYKSLLWEKQNKK